MDTETYNVAREILDKFGYEPPAAKPEDSTRLKEVEPKKVASPEPRPKKELSYQLDKFVNKPAEAEGLKKPRPTEVEPSEPRPRQQPSPGHQNNNWSQQLDSDRYQARHYEAPIVRNRRELPTERAVMVMKREKKTIIHGKWAII